MGSNPGYLLKSFLLYQKHLTKNSTPSYVKFKHMSNTTKTFMLVELLTCNSFIICFLFTYIFLEFQGVERAVASTTLASKKVIGYEKRHSYLLMLKESRSQFQGTPKRADYVKRQMQGKLPVYQ